MEVAVARPQALVPNSPRPDAQDLSFVQRVYALPMQRKLILGGGVAAIVALLVAALLWSRQADYRVLYANLSDKDGGAILAQLSQMNVPYKHADGGHAILVPADKVHDVRLKLASQGLPKGSVAGFELMESQRFGVTQFQERLNFQRGLEGELTRSIESLAAVASARVHLALPNQNGFFREQQKASASVLLNLHAGRTLDRAQIAGIVHLVSSSVPEMAPQAVSVVDQTGALLSGPDASTQNGLDAQQLQYLHQIESTLTKRLVDLLEPVVGRDNLRAQVTAEVDFSQTESTSEEFKPNQGPNAQVALRSQQTTESMGSSTAQPSGVPGAATNQPPVPATAPINGASQPLQTAGGGNGGVNSLREAMTNYEVDKTVRVTRNATGNIKRLNVAVVVNHVTKTDAKGKTTTNPLTQEELDKLTALAREAVGFSEPRGDSVKVVNAPFKVEKIEPVDIPIWKDPDVVDTLRTLAVPGTLLGLALIVVFGAIRPALKAAQQSAPKRLDAVVDDLEPLPGAGQQPGELPALPGPEAAAQDKLEAARKLAKENPAAVANIVRNWVAKEA